MQKPARTIHALLVTILMLASTGCVTFDVPAGLMTAGEQVVGVAVVSTRSPYRIYSYSELQRTSTRAKQWTERDITTQLHLSQRGQYNNWRWTIWVPTRIAGRVKDLAFYPVTAACEQTVSVDACPEINWDSGFQTIYRVAAYLLNAKPLPADIRINLLPRGDGFKSIKFRVSDSAIPLEFTFWLPASESAVSANTIMEAGGLIDLLSRITYEFQHVEYAAQVSRGPRMPRTERVIKDEANSQCWRIAVRLALGARAQTQVSLETVDQQDITLNRQILGPPSLRTAALWGPLLLRFNLGSYLTAAGRGGGDGEDIEVAPADYTIRNRVLAYCRALTHYDGDISTKPMPISEVSKVVFWQRDLGE